MILEIKRKPVIVSLTFIVILFIQNLVIFQNHYFHRAGFPWDFDKAYFAMPAFWTTAVSEGIFPHWMPFQSMGYPFLLNAQNALYYPLLWIFPILNIPFTLQADVIFQVLHVFLGSVGMFFFLKLMLKSPRYALIGAIAFQFFGGFYANSQHQDIIRSFALMPWLFYVLSLDTQRPYITLRNFFIPIVIFFIVTGGYPGIFISTIFVMTLFIIFQAFNIGFHNYGVKKAIKIGTSLFMLIILGISLSIIHLGPFIFHGDELTRISEDIPLAHFHSLQKEHVVGFFMPTDKTFPGRVALASTFVTLPILVFLTFFSGSDFKKHWPFFAVSGIAILMALGPGSLFWDGINSIIPLLGVSRFPLSDYRIFIAIPIILFGILGLKSIIERKLSRKNLAIRTGIIFPLYFLGVFGLGYTVSNNQIIAGALIILACLISIMYYSKIIKFSRKSQLIKKNVGITIVALIIFSSIVVFDGTRVVPSIMSWHTGAFDNSYKKAEMPLEKNGKLITYEIFERTLTERPEREITELAYLFSWKGYLYGDFMMQDYGHTKLLAAETIESNPIYTEFMMAKWTPILLEKNSVNLSEIILSEDIFSNPPLLTTSNNVIQTHYGVNDIIYNVSLTEPMLLVENEMYFPGWKAILIYPDKEVEIDALITNGVFRSWLLPPGNYEMKAYFNFPNFALFQITSVIAFVIWISTMIFYWRKKVPNLSTKYES